MMSRGESEETVIHLSRLEEDVLSLLVGRELYSLTILEAGQRANGGRPLCRVGSLYHVLYRLEKKGLVRAWWGDDLPEERLGARRRYYTATGLGAQVLAAYEQRRQQFAQWQPA
jgi:PadR family transcriptional regulator, regulatory protein PadR